MKNKLSILMYIVLLVFISLSTWSNNLLFEKQLANGVEVVDEVSKKYLKYDRYSGDVLVGKFSDNAEKEILFEKNGKLYNAPQNASDEVLAEWIINNVDNAITNIDDFWSKVVGNANEVKQAFVPNTAILKYTTEDIILYRHCSNNAPQVSNWLTDEILSASQARTQLALPNSNTALRIVKIKVPVGVPYIEGSVAAQPSFGTYAIGGGNQCYFLDQHKGLFQIVEDILNPLGN